MLDTLRHRASLSLLLVASASLVACSGLNTASTHIAGIVTPYKIEIVQGNFVSKEQADALKPGMSRAQARDILGTPLLTSIFHADRWDYVFTFKRQGVAPQARKVTVFFKDDVLDRIEADALPTEQEFVASLDSGRSFGKVPVLEMPPGSLPPSAATPAVAAPEPAATPPKQYPPLEPVAR